MGCAGGCTGDSVYTIRSYEKHILCDSKLYNGHHHLFDFKYGPQNRHSNQPIIYWNCRIRWNSRRHISPNNPFHGTRILAEMQSYKEKT